jgi:hypothetical protein
LNTGRRKVEGRICPLLNRWSDPFALEKGQANGSNIMPEGIAFALEVGGQARIWRTRADDNSDRVVCDVIVSLAPGA